MRAIVVFLMLLWSAPTLAGSVTVFAAASTRNALDDVAVSWQAQTGHTLVVSVAGSSVLARQIAHGAPADLFLSASPEWMDWLAQRGAIKGDRRLDLVGNDLVLIEHGAGAAPSSIEDAVSQDGRIATALVEAVPAGIYAKQALTSLGLWDTLSPRLVQADNVRAALAFVVRGEARFGIVYATDATASDQVSIVARFPAESHMPIVYPVAITASGNQAAASEFLAFLTGPAGRTAFERHGFRWLAP